MKISMRIKVPERLRKFLTNPTPQIDQTMKVADKETLTLLKTDIKAIVHKKSGELAESVQIDLANKKIYSKSLYARAYQLGHYAEPIHTPKRMFLKFTDKGKDVFIRFVRTERKPFFFETLNKDRRKIREIYNKAFKRLLEKI